MERRKAISIIIIIVILNLTVYNYIIPFNDTALSMWLFLNGMTIVYMNILLEIFSDPLEKGFNFFEDLKKNK